MELLTSALKLPYASSSSFIEALEGVEAIDYFFAKQILLSIQKHALNKHSGINITLSFHLLVALSYIQRKGSVCLAIHDLANTSMWVSTVTPQTPALQASFYNAEQRTEFETHIKRHGKSDSGGFLFPNTAALLSACEQLIALCPHNTFLYFEKGNLYSRRYYVYETRFCEFVCSRINTMLVKALLEKRKEQSETIQSLLSIMFEHPLIERHSMKESTIDVQQFAIINSLCSQFSLITGGAGTGKTYTIARLLLLLMVLDGLASESIALLAPTGKAANRLKQSLYQELDNLPDVPQINAAKRALRSVQPSTVHNMLKIDPLRGQTKYSELNPLSVDLLIVDESSMVDISLMDKIICAIPSHASLILVGDPNQLPSVETGSLLADLVSIKSSRLNKEKYKELAAIAPQLEHLAEAEIDNFITSQAIQQPTTENNNLNEGSHSDDNSEYLSTENTKASISESNNKTAKGWISQLLVGKRSNESLNSLAYAILKKDKQAIEAAFELPEITFNDYDFTPSYSNTGATIRPSYSLFTPFLKARLIQQFSVLLNADSLEDAFFALTNYALLSPFRRGYWGVESLNLAIENLLASHFSHLKNTDYYKGKPIMVMVNDYQLGLFNGDVGILWPDHSGELKAFFKKQKNESPGAIKLNVETEIVHTENSFVAFPIYSLPKYETTYAMTIHKTQGSEYKHVDLILPESNKVFLNKQLVYTGLTRAKESIGIWSSKNIFFHAIAHEADRVSGLNTRLE